jgi:hypothetical protein
LKLLGDLNPLLADRLPRDRIHPQIFSKEADRDGISETEYCNLFAKGRLVQSFDLAWVKQFTQPLGPLFQSDRLLEPKFCEPFVGVRRYEEIQVPIRRCNHGPNFRKLSRLESDMRRDRRIRQIVSSTQQIRCIG